MKKSKNNLKISKVIIFFSAFLLVLIVLYIKYISNKQIYATNFINNSTKQLVKISKANEVSLENIIEYKPKK